MRAARVCLTALALLCAGDNLLAQCADLVAPPSPPARDPACKPGSVRRALSAVTRGLPAVGSCEDKHRDAVNKWEEQWRDFGGRVVRSSTQQGSNSRSETVRVRGCRGEVVALELRNSTLRSLTYNLMAPSGRTVASASLNPNRRNGARSAYIQLPETGTYQLVLNAESDSTTYLQNSRTYYFNYELRFPGGGQQPLVVGASETGTLDPNGTYSRRIEVKPGRRVRLTASIQGEAPSRITIAEEDGNPIVDSPLTGRRLVQILPISNDERTYLVRVDAETRDAGRGVEFRLDEVEESSFTLTLGTQVRDSFPGLPRTFDGRRPGDSERMEEFLRSYTLEFEGTGQVTLTVDVAEAAGLVVSMNMFGKESQALLLKNRLIAGRTRIPLMIETQEPIIIEVRPVAARMGPNNRPTFSFRVDPGRF